MRLEEIASFDNSLICDFFVLNDYAQNGKFQIFTFKFKGREPCSLLHQYSNPNYKMLIRNKETLEIEVKSGWNLWNFSTNIGSGISYHQSSISGNGNILIFGREDDGQDFIVNLDKNLRFKVYLRKNGVEVKGGDVFDECCIIRNFLFIVRRLYLDPKEENTLIIYNLETGDEIFHLSPFKGRNCSFQNVKIIVERGLILWHNYLIDVEDKNFIECTFPSQPENFRYEVRDGKFIFYKIISLLDEIDSKNSTSSESDPLLQK